MSNRQMPTIINASNLSCNLSGRVYRAIANNQEGNGARAAIQTQPLISQRFIMKLANSWQADAAIALKMELDKWRTNMVLYVLMSYVHANLSEELTDTNQHNWHKQETD